MTLPKPIPALYTVYVLRSTVRRSSIYIGSTPNPPRRLKQHNGATKGGARRTSRDSLRPWEMICLVSGFPSMVAALKFEWALTNPHSSLHIPTEERLVHSTARKRNGQPKRPTRTLRSVVENLHLLVGVRSFARWPLSLHFHARDIKNTWDSWCMESDKALRPGLNIFEDYGTETGEGENDHGIHAMPLDYAPMKDYVEKAHNVVSFEQEGACIHCNEELESGKGLHPICPNDGCEAMGHLTCWSKKARLSWDKEGILPNLCHCPSCGGEIRWGDMMKELSLRTRGEKEVQKLLKTKKGKRATAVAAV